MHPLFLDIERVLRTHLSLIEYYRGEEGVRDIGLTLDVARGKSDKQQITEFFLKTAQ